MRRIGFVLAAAAAPVLLLGLALVAALRPPALPTPERRDWVFRNVTLVEPGREPRSGRTLRVVDGRIASSDLEGSDPEGGDLERSDLGGGDPAAEEAVDLGGLYVAPGLVDMHVHYPPRVAVGNAELWSLLLLVHGVTSVRETGSIDGSIFSVREAIRAGSYPGPRLFVCGPMLDGDPPSFPSNRLVRTRVEARAAVEELAARGVDCIKVYNMLIPEALTAIREAAARAGLPLVGHAPHSVAFEEAGIADLQHGTGAVQIDPATIGRSDFQTADWKTVDDARIAYVAEVSLAQDIAHTPTLVNARMRRLLVSGDAEGVARDSGLRHLPRFWPAVWAAIWTPPFSAGHAEGEALHDRFRARQAALTAGLHAAGVRVHAGTDTLMPYVAPGSSLHGELAELVSAGLPPDAVWRIATREAGRALGAAGLGTLEPGAPADLLFLRSDPGRNLGALSRIEAVLADGRLYRRGDLETALARLDAHFQGGLYEASMGIAIRLLTRSFAPEEPLEKPPPRTTALRGPGTARAAGASGPCPSGCGG